MPYFGKNLKDPLEYLPCSRIEVIPARQLIYGESDPAPSLYAVIEGLVKLSYPVENGREVIVDFCQHDDFFGEAAFLYSQHSQSAIALANTKLMSWTATEVEGRILKRPELGMALCQVAVERTTRLAGRIGSLASHEVAGRLLRALLSLGERFGEAQNGGGVRLFPITHEVLAQFIGTSRELVTQHMIQLRRHGCVQYSRRELLLYPNALRRYIADSGKVGVGIAGD